MRGDTGLPRADVENDFLRARRHQVLSRLGNRLRREPDDVNLILPFDDVVSALGMEGERDLGLQTIALDTVVGTVDSHRDFDRRFRPTSARVRERWERLALAQRRGESIPPIDAYVIDVRTTLPGRRHQPTRRPAGQELRTAVPLPRPVVTDGPRQDHGDRPGSGTDAEGYLRVTRERYRLIRTHDWNDDVLRRLREQIR